MKKLIEKIKMFFSGSRIYILPGISVVMVFILVGFAEKSHRSKACENLNVDILDEEEYQFINKKDIVNIITNHGTDPIQGTNISTIQLRQIENRLLQNSFIKDAQAYIDMKPEMFVKIKQRIPVARIENSKGEQYYIDNEGKTMPLSPNFTARVPIVTASFSPANNDSTLTKFNTVLFKFIANIDQDKFASALCGQITVDNRYEFSIIPRLGNIEIFMGDTSDLPNKIVRLKSFYKSSLPQAGWEKYRSISVKYKNQVIATENKE